MSSGASPPVAGGTDVVGIGVDVGVCVTVTVTVGGVIVTVFVIIVSVEQAESSINKADMIRKPVRFISLSFI
jgi:hypothetical protein